MENPPWLDMFLEAANHEMTTPLPRRFARESTEHDQAWISQQTKDSFDILHLKQQMIEDLGTNAQIYKQECSLGSILVVSYKPIIRKQWDAWWHCIRFVCPGKSVRVTLFLHPKKRELPSHGAPITQEHINGGTTFQCNEKTVLVYREEESQRVLLHELFHGNCTDPYHLPVPLVEADTEGWAELCLCALVSKGQPKRFQTLWKQQQAYAANQAAYVATYHGVHSPHDYAWRYTTGRLDTWARLGFSPPYPPSVPHPRKTGLRLTVCEL